MLESANQQHKWQDLNQHIEQWLNHRAQLLTHHCKIANLLPYEKTENTLPSQDEMYACGDLVDYVSEGHFEIYEEIMAFCEQTQQGDMKLHQTIVPEIHLTIDEALHFHDKYTDQKRIEMDHLDEDLNELGVVMEKRFELEDLLLETINLIAEKEPFILK